MEANKIIFYKELPEEKALLGYYHMGGNNIFVGIFRFAPYYNNYVLVDDAVANTRELAEKRCLKRYYKYKKTNSQ